MELTCAIVDDEPLALNLLESYVRKTPFLRFQGGYASAIEAMHRLPENPVDLLFLDIQMPGLSGLEFSKMLPAETRVVFTTAFNQYAVDSYRVNALDYLLKPISYADFMLAAGKALQWFEMKHKTEKSDKTAENESLFVKSGRKLLQVPLDELLYAEAQKDYVRLVCETTEPILALISLKNLEDSLPADRFMRVHRSFIVQKSKIREVENNRIVFGKVYIPVGDLYKDDFQRFINKTNY